MQPVPGKLINSINVKSHINAQLANYKCKINDPSIFYILNGQQYLLDEFEKIDTSDFCLAHLFTYRDIPQGIQGLGYKKTMCRARWNKGFTTLLNHKVSYKSNCPRIIDNTVSFPNDCQ